MGAIVDIYRFSSPGMGKVKFKYTPGQSWSMQYCKFLSKHGHVNQCLYWTPIEWDFVISKVEVLPAEPKAEADNTYRDLDYSRHHKKLN